MKKILLTGSTGFLGKTILNILKNSYYIVQLTNPGDINKIRLNKEIPNFIHAFDIIIHCAGKAHLTPKSELDKNEFFEVNVKGTENLLKGLSLLPKQFVFISSVAVYGSDFGCSISENKKLTAKDPYGFSKIQAEHLITDWCQKNNVVCTILRLPLLVGKNPPGNLGAMLKAIKQGYYFNIAGGTAKKSMVLAEDVAKFIPKIAAIGGTYNLTDRIHPTFSALSRAIAKKELYNLPLSLAKFLGFIGDLMGDKAPFNSLKLKKITSDLTFDDSRAVELGWLPRSVLEYLEENVL